MLLFGKIARRSSENAGRNGVENIVRVLSATDKTAAAEVLQLVAGLLAAMGYHPKSFYVSEYLFRLFSARCRMMDCIFCLSDVSAFGL